ALGTANLAAKIGVDSAQLSLTDMKGTLDGADAQGGLAVRLGSKLGVSGGLTLDRLLLDPWLPDGAVLDRPAAAYTAAVKALASSSFDTDLKLLVKQANWRGARFGPLAFDVQSEAGRLTVRRFEISVAGLHATASGTLGDGGRVSEGRLELMAQEIAPLQPFIPHDTAWVTPLVKGPANLLVVIAGPPEALGVKATLDLGDLRAEMQPVLNIPARRWAGPLMLHHPGAPRLLEQLGFGGTASWLGDGSFSAITQLSHAPGRLELGTIDLVAGGMRLTGQVSQVDQMVQGRLRAETLMLPAIDLRSVEPLPFAALASHAATIHLDADQVMIGTRPGITEAALDAEVKDGALSLTSLVAKFGGGTVALSAKMQPGDRPRVSVQGQTEGVDISGPVLGGTLDLVAGTLKSKFSLESAGFSPAALVATLSGSGNAGVLDGGVVGLDAAAAKDALLHSETGKLAPALRPALLGGSTVFSTIDIPFDIQRGILALRAQGTAASGAVSLNGTIDLTGGTLEGRLTLLPGPDLPDLPVRLSGPVANPVRTPELAGAALWLAERP
ncbi:MAG: AsmA-like C-terminal region-containing protein, partial [Pseudomonadota bacterium]|nr:AsmA-like C-terminal region-containing protein [Pseudomonadota bacterium]